jgi:ribosome biogenesis GTPase
LHEERKTEWRRIVTINNNVNTHKKSEMQGRVFKKSLGQYFVKADGRVVTCSISNRFRKDLVYPLADPASIRPHVVAVKDISMVDPIAIGDEVSFIDSGDGSGMISEVLPRKNKLSRRAAGKKPLEQVIVANVDQIVAVFAAAKPTPKWRLLDRYLADAEAVSIPVLICITKLDLVNEEGFREKVKVYEDIGYPVVFTSALTGRGIEEFKDVLKNRVSLLMGKSGVGKTTLLNTIQPGLGLRVSEVSKSTGKGKHITSHLEMFELDFGGSVVDTPGMREFGLWNCDSVDLASLFREMRPFISLCRFGMDCSHTHEPGCAIKEAVQTGDISEARYESYLRMRK